MRTRSDEWSWPKKVAVVVGLIVLWVMVLISNVWYLHHVWN